MGKDLYLLIDPALPAKEGEEQTRLTILTTKLPEVYLDKTVEDLVQYGTDPERYQSAGDKQTAMKIQGWFREMNADPENKPVDVILYTKDEPPADIDVNLSDHMAQYKERVIQDRPITDNSGAKIPCRVIEMGISPGYDNGLDAIVRKYEARLLTR
jgi:hypothetical protein